MRTNITPNTAHAIKLADAVSLWLFAAAGAVIAAWVTSSAVGRIIEVLPNRDVAVLATFIAFLDGSVVGVALPAIGRELGGGLAAQQWIVDAYLLTLGSVILLAGSLSDLFGRRRVLFWGLLGFGIASVACAVAPTAEVLILARGLQGVAGALLVPSSLALILSAFQGPAQARAIGVWTAITSLASIAGPIVGGVLVDTLSWRWVFAINLLPIAVALVLVRALPADAQRQSGTRVDWFGALLGIAGLGLPVFALIESGRFGWGSPVILTALGLGAVGLVAFVLWERRAAAPMLPLAIFRSRQFSAANVTTLFVYAGLSSVLFLIGIVLQQALGYSPLEAGAATFPITVIMLTFSARAGALAQKIGPRWPMTLGPAIIAVGLVLMTRIEPGRSYAAGVLPALLVFSAGLALTVADNGYMGLLSASWLDFEAPDTSTESIVLPFTRGRMKLPESADAGDIVQRHPKISLSFRHETGGRRLAVDCPGFAHGRGLRGEIHLAQPAMDRMVIATPFPKAPRAFYYNQKINCMPASGEIEFGGKRQDRSARAPTSAARCAPPPPR